MNPLKIHGTGYGRFDEFTLDIPAGSAAIVGPNGAGKSRLLNAIELCLFAGRGELAQWLAPGHDKLLLELEFEHGGELYRVRRSYQGGTRGRQAVDLEHHVGDAWEPLTREDAKATDQLISDTLGLTRATFGASAFLAQGKTGDFAEADPAERKKLLGAMLDPHGLWARLADQARKDRAAAETDTELFARQMQERAARVDEIPLVEQRVTTLELAEIAERRDLEQAETVLEEAQRAVVDHAAAGERVKALTVARERAQIARDLAGREVDSTLAAQAELADTDVKLAAARKLAAFVPELERKVAEQQTAREQAAAANRARAEFLAVATRHAATAARLKAEGDDLGRQHAILADRLVAVRDAEDGTERCDRCEQLLGAESKDAALKSLTAELAEVGARITAKVDLAHEEKKLADLAATDAAGVEVPPVPEGDLAPELTVARDAQMRSGTLAERAGQLGKVAVRIPEVKEALELREAELADAVQELASALTDTPDAATLDRTVTDARSRVATCRNTVEATCHDLARAKQQLDQLRDTERELRAIEQQRTLRLADVDRFRLAERWAGRDGVPTLIAENAIPQIELEANRILELMPTAKGETLRVELRTQRENKTNDNVRETLDIVAFDQHGPRAYETYSGGEKGRLNVALRLALAQLLANRRGAESRVLCLDEVEYLDQLGQEQLVDVIRSVAGAYDRVLVVSHAAGVRDAFETVVELESDEDGVSRLVAAKAGLSVVAA